MSDSHHLAHVAKLNEMLTGSTLFNGPPGGPNAVAINYMTPGVPDQKLGGGRGRLSRKPKVGMNCKLCNKATVDAVSLRLHMRAAHSLQSIFMCSCCRWAFETRAEMVEHIIEKKAGKNAFRPPIAVPIRQQDQNSLEFVHMEKEQPAKANRQKQFEFAKTFLEEPILTWYPPVLMSSNPENPKKNVVAEPEKTGSATASDSFVGEVLKLAALVAPSPAFTSLEDLVKLAAVADGILGSENMLSETLKLPTFETSPASSPFLTGQFDVADGKEAVLKASDTSSSCPTASHSPSCSRDLSPEYDDAIHQSVLEPTTNAEHSAIDEVCFNLWINRFSSQ